MISEEMERKVRSILEAQIRIFRPEDTVEMMVIDNVEPADCGCCPENVTVTIKMDISLKGEES